MNQFESNFVDQIWSGYTKIEDLENTLQIYVTLCIYNTHYWLKTREKILCIYTNDSIFRKNRCLTSASEILQKPDNSHTSKASMNTTVTYSGIHRKIYNEPLRNNHYLGFS